MTRPPDDAVTGPHQMVPMAPTVGAGPVGLDPWARPSPLPTAPADNSVTAIAVDAPIEADSLSTDATADDHVGWNFADVLAGLGALLLLSQLLAWPFLADPHLPAELRLVVAGFLPVWLGLGGAAVLVARIRGSGRLGAELGLRFRWLDLAIGVGLGLGLRLASGLITSVVQSISGQRADGNLTQISGTGVGRAATLVNLFIAATLIAPLIEELFFRGLLIRSLLATLKRRGVRRGRVPGPTLWRRQRQAVVVVSAVLFALLHLSEVRNPVGAVSLMLTLLLVGGVHAAISLHTGRLGAAILSHVVFNGSAALLALTLLPR